jgi:hypothetical protein
MTDARWTEYVEAVRATVALPAMTDRKLAGVDRDRDRAAADAADRRQGQRRRVEEWEQAGVAIERSLRERLAGVGVDVPPPASSGPRTAAEPAAIVAEVRALSRALDDALVELDSARRAAARARERDAAESAERARRAREHEAAAARLAAERARKRRRAVIAGSVLLVVLVTAVVIMLVP